jgi:hypothetical protein
MMALCQPWAAAPESAAAAAAAALPTSLCVLIEVLVSATAISRGAAAAVVARGVSLRFLCW